MKRKKKKQRDPEMASRLSSRDVSGFKFIFFLAIIYTIISLLVHSVLHMKFITPLSIDAPLDRFSEARAIHHVAVLTKDDRQVSPALISVFACPSCFVTEFSILLFIYSLAFNVDKLKGRASWIKKSRGVY